MKTRIAGSVIALVFLSMLIVADGQIRKIQVKNKKTPADKEQSSSSGLVPEIGGYGNLIGLKDVNGNEVFGNDKSLHEGWALAYQIGQEPAQFIYAVGGQVTSEKFKRESGPKNGLTVILTTDGVWQITHQATWNESKGTLEIWRTLKNISSKPVRLLMFEVQMEAKLAFGRTHFSKLPYLEPSFRIPLGSGLVIAPLLPGKCSCNPCFPPRDGCLPGLKDSGWFKAAVTIKDQDSRMPAFSVSSVGVPIFASKDNLVVNLSWARNANLPSELVRPNGEVKHFVRYNLRDPRNRFRRKRSAPSRRAL